jgi:hypothetical protein
MNMTSSSGQSNSKSTRLSCHTTVEEARGGKVKQTKAKNLRDRLKRGAASIHALVK